MGAYKSVDLKEAKWISTGGACSTPMIRQKVVLPKVKEAKITIAGLGIYEVFINGKKVSEDLFLPLSTDFHERPEKLYYGKPYDEQLRHRLYCPVYDVTSYLQEGENAICFWMGPGWYEVPGECYEYGRIKVCYALTYQDEAGESHVVGSDETACWKPGYVKQASLLGGEVHDYADYEEAWLQAGYEDAEWNAVTLEEAPQTRLYEQDCPADRVIRHLQPKLVRETETEKIYDVGELITGYPVFVSKASAGEKITVLHGELLNSEGTLEEENIYNQKTVFYTDGTERKMHCRFTWFGFRYFSVTGDAEPVDCLVIHTDIAVTSKFSSSNEVLNWLQEAYIRTQLDNMHCGIPSDCPHAERKGYTGDGQLTCEAVMLQMDAQKFYKKWIYDISDCQDAISGHVQYTAPYLPAGGGPGGWGCAIVVVPYMYYKHYGDKKLLEELYPQMLHYLDYLEAHSENDLVVSDHEGDWCLGDWCVLEMDFLIDMDNIRIPAPLVNTYFYVKSMELLLEIGAIIGNTEMEQELRRKIAVKKQAITDAYYDPATGDFAENQQGSNVFAVDIGLGDERTFAHIVEHYREIKKYDTGIFGTDILTRLLFERGESNLAAALLSSTEEQAFGSFMKMGKTTIQEHWQGYRSQCHPMFGAVTKYLYQYILGIRQCSESVRYEKIVIEPLCMERIESAEGYVTTASGRISVKYDKKQICVEIPPQVQAVLKQNGQTIELPAGQKTVVERATNIFLIGFMGAGKSTIARCLQQHCGMHLIEMDEQIEAEQGMKISEIFAQKGEAYFRSLETALLTDLGEKEHMVVSCGGGVPLRAENVEVMKKSGQIVYLSAAPETIYQRVCGSHNRPLLEGNMNVPYIQELMQARLPKYQKAADVTVETDGKTAEEISQEIAAACGKTRTV